MNSEHNDIQFDEVVYLVQPGKGLKFWWPKEENESYYLYWPKSNADNYLKQDQLLCVTPRGISTNYPEDGPDHDLNLTWVRVTDRVVMEHPVSLNPVGNEGSLLLDLGLTYALIKNPVDRGEKGVDSQLKFQTEESLDRWNEKFSDGFFDRGYNYKGREDTLYLLIEGWAFRANWLNHHNWEIAATLMSDLRGNPAEQRVAELFHGFLAKKACRKLDALAQMIAEADQELGEVPPLLVGPQTRKFVID
jgi:hypothetical protein